jgi:hypothetical protein
MPTRDLDLTSLVAGVALAIVGALLLLDATDTLDLGIVGAASAVLAAIGATVVASGVARARRR